MLFSAVTEVLLDWSMLYVVTCSRHAGKLVQVRRHGSYADRVPA